MAKKLFGSRGRSIGCITRSSELLSAGEFGLIRHWDSWVRSFGMKNSSVSNNVRLMWGWSAPINYGKVDMPNGSW